MGCFGLVQVQENVVEDVLPQLLLGEGAGWDRLGRLLLRAFLLVVAIDLPFLLFPHQSFLLNQIFLKFLIILPHKIKTEPQTFKLLLDLCHFTFLRLQRIPTVVLNLGKLLFEGSLLLLEFFDELKVLLVWLLLGFWG